MSKKKQKIKESSTQEKKQEEKIVRVLLIIASLIFFAGATLLNFKPAYDYTIIKDILGAIFVAIFAIVLFLRKEDIYFHQIGFITGTLFFVYILIGCSYAPVKYGAAQSLENYLLYYLLFLTGMLWKWKEVDSFIWAGAMIIASIVGFIQFPITHYPISTFGNPNFFAGHLLMPAFLTIYFFKKRYNIFFVALYLVIILVAFILIKSRASLFALLFSSACASFFLLRNHRIKWLKYIGFAVVFVGTILMWNKIQTQFVEDIRYYIWRGTWNLIKAKPLTGWGTGNFIFYYPYFRFREYFLRPQATPITNHPHCQYLEIWSENGLIALILFGFIFGFVIRNGLRKNSPDSENVLLFAIPAIIAVCVDNILSTNLTNTSTAMYFWFLLGLCFSVDSVDNKIVISGQWKKVAGFFMLVSMIILAGWKTYYRLIPEVYLKRAISAREANDFLSAIENYKKVCKINTNHVVAWYKMAFAYGQIGDLKKAEEVYLKINNVLFPHFAKTDANLATLYTQLNDVKKAKYYFEWALWFNPYDIDVLFNLASIKLYKEKDIKAAAEYLKKVARISPQHEYLQYLLKTVPGLKDLVKIETQINKGEKQ